MKTLKGENLFQGIALNVFKEMEKDFKTCAIELEERMLDANFNLDVDFITLEVKFWGKPYKIKINRIEK